MFLSEYSGKVIPTGEFKTDDFLISLKDALNNTGVMVIILIWEKILFLKDQTRCWASISERFMSILVNMHHIHTHVLNSVGMSGHMD